MPSESLVNDLRGPSTGDKAVSDYVFKLNANWFA